MAVPLGGGSARVLEELGLTAVEDVVWQGLLDRLPLTVGELCQVVGESDACVVAAVAGLEAKGLVIRLAGVPVRYTVTAPDIALDVLVRAKEEKLQQVRVLAEQVMQRYLSGRSSSAAPTDVVEVVRGAEAALHRWRQIHRVATAEVCGLSRPPYATDANPDQVERMADGVAFRTVYDSSVLELPGRLAGIEEFVADGEQARVGTVPVKALIADERVGMISLQHPATTDAVLVVHESSLLVALRALFEAIWVTALPVLVGAEAPASEHRRLLTFLAAGMTDRAIARQLGWHLTTVQRRVRRLMGELGVRTRFQAGLEAAHRGWL